MSIHIHRGQFRLKYIKLLVPVFNDLKHCSYRKLMYSVSRYLRKLTFEIYLLSSANVRIDEIYNYFHYSIIIY